MSFPLVSNAYLEESTAKIRAKPVPWEGYQRAGLVTSDELTLIKRVDRQPKARMDVILLTEGRTYARLYLKLLKKLTRVDTMQWILVLIGDMMADHEERKPLFIETSVDDPDLPYTPLLRALQTQDEFLQLKSSQLLTLFLSSETNVCPGHILQPFLEIISFCIESPSLNRRDVGVQCLQNLLPRTEFRKAVWSSANFIPSLRNILKQKPNAQTSYQICFCFWLLTFEQDIAENINKNYDIISLLTEVAQAAVKEKVIRVIVAAFRNMILRAPSQNLPSMLVVQTFLFIKSLCNRKWTDTDIVDDVHFLRDELCENFNRLTTYEEYTSELLSGHLSWSSPIHDSESFWEANAAKLCDADYAELKLLLRLLKESNDPTVLAVAAHDVGQFVKYCEKGKKAVSDLGGKSRIMLLMAHESPDVRYRALISVQRLVSQSWRAS